MATVKADRKVLADLGFYPEALRKNGFQVH